jgi:hypothetical protein
MALAYGHLEWQRRTADYGSPAHCLRLFKSNRDVGAIVFAVLVVAKMCAKEEEEGEVEGNEVVGSEDGGGVEGMEAGGGERRGGAAAREDTLGVMAGWRHTTGYDLLREMTAR